ncbi:hypothetical protein HAP94_08455 [Acidithiobacillus ferrivorans]|nr:hypothetical protein [Acidithiobacillus ferrivorans]
MTSEYLPFDLTATNDIHSIKKGEFLTEREVEYKPVERLLPPPVHDLIHEDELLHVMDHAFDARPGADAGMQEELPDLIHKDEMAAADAAWMTGKPWKKPAADTPTAAADHDKER